MFDQPRSPAQQTDDSLTFKNAFDRRREFGGDIPQDIHSSIHCKHIISITIQFEIMDTITLTKLKSQC